jgi:hypothetical protein
VATSDSVRRSAEVRLRRAHAGDAGQESENKRQQRLAHPRAKPRDRVLEMERWRLSGSTAAAHLRFHGSGDWRTTVRVWGKTRPQVAAEALK